MVAEIKDEVRRRRAAGEFPRPLLDRLSAIFELPDDRQDPELFAVVDSVQPLHSDRPLIGPAITFSKRAVRRLLSWYVQPIAHEQTEFNLALLRQVRTMQAQVAGIATVWSPAQSMTSPGLRDAAAARARALDASGIDVSDGVAVVGCDAALEAELTGRGIRVVTARTADAPEWVASLARAPRSVLYLAGALCRATPAEAVNLVQLARHALVSSGALVVDAPLAADAQSDPAAVDVTMRRWLAPDAATLLLEVAGFESPRRVDVDGPLAGHAQWYMVLGTSPAL